MLEQRCVISFLLKDGVPRKAIADRLDRVYGEDAMKKSQVFVWVQGGWRGREDLRDAKRRHHPLKVDFHAILAHKMERNPDGTARKLILTLGAPHKL
jgi:hypothetical protein